MSAAYAPRVAEFGDTPLTADYAVAALRWGAAQEAAPDGAHQSAISMIRELKAGPDGRVALEDVFAIIRKYVPEPGSVIHGWGQATRDAAIKHGTYWALDDAIAMAREPGAACAWAAEPDYHDLRVTAADGVTVRFHVFCPERFTVSNPVRRVRLLAEIASQQGR